MLITMQFNSDIHISDYDYPLPDERIAKFPMENRDMSKLLVYNGGDISHTLFRHITSIIPADAMLVFNNTRVVHARIIMHKPSGARIEVFCLEPHAPADYERAFAVKGSCEWKCIIGNSKKWKEGALEIVFEWGGANHSVRAYRVADSGGDNIVRFEWDADMTFGQLLELLGRIPIPPYLGRDSQDVDNTRYQTVYSKIEGSVAAPTAGLHFTDALIEEIKARGIAIAEVTLHVGAGTFLPVKSDSVTAHHMHTEYFEMDIDTVRRIASHKGAIVPVGTTSVRTIESLAVLGYRVLQHGNPDESRHVEQWEPYDIPDGISGRELLRVLVQYMADNDLKTIKSATQIMIMPGYRFLLTDALITNFHQPKSTLLLLVSALIGERWRDVYKYALDNEFRFLSYGDSSILIP
jgi:S-adenosylmethionine:tRNA ribosyltransferase-isomerase